MFLSQLSDDGVSPGLYLAVLAAFNHDLNDRHAFADGDTASFVSLEVQYWVRWQVGLRGGAPTLEDEDEGSGVQCDNEDGVGTHTHTTTHFFAVAAVHAHLVYLCEGDLFVFLPGNFVLDPLWLLIRHGFLHCAHHS